MRSKTFSMAGLIVAALPAVLAAQQMGIPATSVPIIMQGVGIDQNLNAQIPLALTFRLTEEEFAKIGAFLDTMEK